MSDLDFLYEQTRKMRETLFTYLETLPPEVLHQTHPAFGHGSIAQTAAHIVNTYRFWLNRDAYEESGIEPVVMPLNHGVALLRVLYMEVDEIVYFHLNPSEDLEREFEWSDPKGNLRVSGRWLLLHPLTHEFHHKGQMVSLGRALGHPVGPRFDTDLPPPGGW